MSGNKNYNNNICQNCGNKGHHIRNCINPITSLGIVLYKKCKEMIELGYLE